MSACETPRPSSLETLKQMASDGVQNAPGFYSLVAPNRSELGSLPEKYCRRACRAWPVTRRRSTTATAGTIIRFSFKRWVELIETRFAKIAAEPKSTTPSDFHRAQCAGPPWRTRSPYVEQLQTTARLIAEKLGQQQLVTRLSKPQRQTGRSLARTRHRRRDPQSRRRGLHRCRRRAHRLCLRPCRSSLRSRYRSEENRRQIRHQSTARAAVPMIIRLLSG